MTPERWARIRRVFEAVVAAQPEARREAVEQACGDDASLRNEVLALLAAGDAAGGAPGQGQFLEKPVHAFEDYRAEPGAPPRRIGPFEIHGELGVGGMGAVYRAHRVDDPTRTPIAVKVMRHGLAAGELRERFYKEEAILAALDHPGIARLLDAGVTDAGSPWLAMQLIDGLPLTTWAERRELSTRARLTLFLQVCDAVAYAHGRRVVHRDLKPANILVTHAGEARLLDFGIAKLLPGGDEAQAMSTVTHAGLMTIDYASPEQVLGEPVDERSDVYALGVVLCELLTGRRPYRVTTRGRPEALLKAMLVDAPQPPSALVRADRPGDPRAEALADELAGDLDAIVTHALAKSADERCTSVAALAADLRHHLAGRIPAARTLPVTRRLGRFARRRSLAAAALVVAAGLAGVAALWLAGAGAGAVDAGAAARAAEESRRAAAAALDAVEESLAEHDVAALDETTRGRLEHELDRAAQLSAHVADPQVRRRWAAAEARLGELGGPGARVRLQRARTLFAELSAADPADARLALLAADARFRLAALDASCPELAAAARAARAIGLEEAARRAAEWERAAAACAEGRR
ncbi:MAG: serine/threonine protein kinase [Vicinamibacteria bacterium]|nr:serine/threonine protein kinase [Vicinamibacteria bacterium]